MNTEYKVQIITLDSGKIIHVTKADKSAVTFEDLRNIILDQAEHIIKMRELLQAVHDAAGNVELYYVQQQVDEYINSLPK